MSEQDRTPNYQNKRVMPVQSSERIDFVDILRGFAVYGILVMNITAFSGQEIYPANIPDPIDRIVVILVNFLIQAKFYSLFSFLFGWGMAVQMGRAEAKGAGFLPRFVRRLSILLAIGLLHTVFIWHGDILTLYAALGFFLLLWRKRSDKVILAGVVLCLLFSIVMTAPGEVMDNVRSWYESATSFIRTETTSKDIFATGTYLEIVQHNFSTTINNYSWILFFFGNILSMFLLGLFVGRRGIFQNIGHYLPLVRWVMWMGLVIGAIFNGIFVYAGSHPDWAPAGYQRFVTVGSRTIGAPALMLFYVTGIILLLQRETWRERLTPLKDVGRMALTNYLVQSVLFTLIFYSYGLGFYGETSATLNQILVIFVFLAQIRFSAWWFGRYQFGPVEWLWRTLTYGKRQPMWVGETYENIKPSPWYQKTRRFIGRVNPLAALISVWIVLSIWGLGLIAWNARLASGVSEAPFEVVVKVTATAQPLAEGPQDRPASVEAQNPAAPHYQQPVYQPGSVAATGDVWALAATFDVDAAFDQIVTLTGSPYFGRHAGSPEGWAAGDYIAAQFASYGLQPAGDDGTFFQSFPVTYTPLDRMPSLVVVGSDGDPNAGYQLHQDFAPIIRWYSGPGKTSGQVVWVNQCSPTDFHELDVVDKIVFCTGGSGSTPYQESSRNALEHGAAGLLLLTDQAVRPPDMGNTFYETWVPAPIPTFRVYPSLASDLLSGSGKRVSDLLSGGGESEPFDLSTQVRLEVTTAGGEACAAPGCQARNVLGVIPGRDPAYAGEVVILGAHYDHLGDAPDGTVWPGANDDASGMGVLLEIARSWQEQGYLPLRTVVFAAWDAEEIGLAGSRHYVKNPRYPLDATIAMFQLDMVGAGPGPLLISGEQALGSEISAVAVGLGVEAEGVDMGRSDHAPFLEAGIPASLLIYFDGGATVQHYHRPVDSPEVIELDKLEAAANVVEIAALDLVESKPAIDRLLAQRAAAVENGDIGVFLATSDRGQDAVDRYWFNDLQSFSPAEVEIEPVSIQVSGSTATAEVEIRVEYPDDLAPDGAGVLVGRLSTRFERGGDGWLWAGPNLALVGDTGSGAEEPEAGMVVLYPPESPRPDALDLLAAQKYAEMAARLGLPTETGAMLILLPDTGSIRVSTGLSLPLEQDVWVTADEVKLVYSEEISASVTLDSALAQLVLAEAGVTESAAPWLWDGLPLVFQARDDRVGAHVRNIPPLVEFLETGQVSRNDVTSWAATDYLLSRLGWAGLGAFISDLGLACRQGLCETSAGLDSALENDLYVDTVAFAPLWQHHWRSRLDAAQAGIDAVLSARMDAVRAGGAAGANLFLDTVDPAIPHLVEGERYWYADLKTHPVESYSLAGSPLALLEDGSVLAAVTTRYKHTDPADEAGEGEVTTRIMFTRGGDDYRWAGAPFETKQGELIQVRYPVGRDELAEGILAEAQVIYQELAATLEVETPDELSVSLFEDKDSMRTSISLSYKPVNWAPGWTGAGAGVKLLTSNDPDPGAYSPALAIQLARNLLHQAGVEAEWLLKGYSVYLSGPFDGRVTQKEAGAHLPELSLAAHEGRVFELAGLRRDDEYSQDEFHLARTQAWDTVRFLVDTYGWRALIDLVHSNSQGANPEATLDGSLASFQDAWAESLSRGHIAEGWVEVAESFDQDLAGQHVESLASRELAGRKAGSPGSDLAAVYIASEFAANGLIPAGDLERTSFYQHFPISDTNFLSPPRFELLDDHRQTWFSFDFRDDFWAVRHVTATVGPVSGELVFVRDQEVQDVDLTGKIVVLKLSGRLGDKGAWTEDVLWAQEENASALIVVGNKDEEDEYLAKTPLVHGYPVDSDILVFELTQPGYKRFLEAIGHDRTSIQKIPSGQPLGINARLEYDLSPLKTIQTANVLGLLPGADPVLSREWIVIGAHYDHVGDDPDHEVCLAVTGDSSPGGGCEIVPGKAYSGANDDASGVAALLEIARVWHESGYRPERSVLFAAWGAQELGQIGSGTFLESPTLSLDDLVGVVQLVGIGGGGGFYPGAQGDWEQDGILLFSLTAAQTHLDEKLVVVPNYQESDHIPFDEMGFPSLLVSWRLAGEENLPDGFANAAIPDRLGIVGRLVTLFIMALAS